MDISYKSRWREEKDIEENESNGKINVIVAVVLWAIVVVIIYNKFGTTL